MVVGFLSYISDCIIFIEGHVIKWHNNNNDYDIGDPTQDMVMRENQPNSHRLFKCIEAATVKSRNKHNHYLKEGNKIEEIHILRSGGQR